MKRRFGTPIAIALVLAILLTAAVPFAGFADTQRDAPRGPRAAINPADYSILISLLDQAGLGSLMSGRQSYTLFAPTNQAFADLFAAYPGVDACLTDPENVELLQSVLAYHATQGKRFSDSLFPSENLMMLNGAYAMTSLNDGPMIENAHIIAPFDIGLRNGVIHSIDAVIVDSATFGEIVSTCYPS